MFKVYWRNQGEYVVALILGQKANETEELEKWGKDAATRKSNRDYKNLSSAMEFVGDQGAAIWKLRDPGGYGELDGWDMDRLLKPK